MIRRFKRLFPYLRRHAGAMTLGMICLFLGNYFEITMAVLFGMAVDSLSVNLGPLKGLEGSFLNIFIGLTLAMGLAAAFFRFWMRRLIIGVSRHIEFEFRNDFFAHLLKLPAAVYDRRRTGDIMSRATSDMDAVRMVIGPAIMYLANTLVMLPMAIFKMAQLSPMLTLICMAPMLIIAPIFYFFKRHIHDRSLRTQELMSDLSAFIQETFSGIRVVKVHARESDQAAKFNAVSTEYVGESLRLAMLQAVFMPLLMIVVSLSVLALLWGGSYLIIAGSVSIGALFTFFTLLMASIFPMIAIGWVLSLLERGAASMERIDEVFNEPLEIRDHATTQRELPELEGLIEFRAMTFQYEEAEKPALIDVNLTIEAGTTLGITGPIGCGKSTLAALVARRYSPPRGTLLIDGVDILDWPVEGLRARIGVVDQEPFLFSDTIEANILYGVDPVSLNGNAHARARQAAEIAQLEGDLSQLPHGFETILGERGINLSGGQRQRTALARALAREPRMLLLDDALAAVDTHTEEAILRGLRTVLGRSTTLIVSHRISTVSLADRIVYLEGGRIIEQGTHEELIELGGKYWTLARKQQLAEEIERTA